MQIIGSRQRRLAAVLALAIAVDALPLAAQRARSTDAGNWIPTWTTAQQMMRQPTPPPAAAPATVPHSDDGIARDALRPLRRSRRRRPPSRPRPPPLPPLQTLKNQTIRMTLRTSIGGKRVRVKLSNTFNGTPVELGAAHLAIRSTRRLDRRRLRSAADVRRAAVGDDDAGHGGRQRSGGARVQAADGPLGQPVLPWRYRPADDSRERAAADLRVG